LPRLIVTRGATIGLDGCRRFLAKKNKEASQRAGQAIQRRFAQLETAPEIGRPFAESPDLRELIIEFGDSGYVALYRHSPEEDAVTILAFRHQKEAGY
jgi:plasmid stabilization system protein ParE